MANFYTIHGKKLWHLHALLYCIYSCLFEFVSTQLKERLMSELTRWKSTKVAKKLSGKSINYVFTCFTRFLSLAFRLATVTVWFPLWGMPRWEKLIFLLHFDSIGLAEYSSPLLLLAPALPGSTFIFIMSRWLLLAWFWELGVLGQLTELLSGEPFSPRGDIFIKCGDPMVTISPLLIPVAAELISNMTNSFLNLITNSQTNLCLLCFSFTSQELTN